MDGIPTNFAPKEPATEEEWECFYENLVRDFMEQNYGGIVSQVDITAFAAKYLHMHIVSAIFDFALLWRWSAPNGSAADFGNRELPRPNRAPLGC